MMRLLLCCAHGRMIRHLFRKLSLQISYAEKIKGKVLHIWKFRVFFANFVFYFQFFHIALYPDV